MRPSTLGVARSWAAYHGSSVTLAIYTVISRPMTLMYEASSHAHTTVLRCLLRVCWPQQLATKVFPGQLLLIPLNCVVMNAATSVRSLYEANLATFNPR
eukprot:3689319-Amphidinium_carterae.2